MALSGHSREEFERLAGENAFNMVYELDRGRVLEAMKAALRSGEVLDVFFRMRHKEGRLIWVHLNLSLIHIYKGDGYSGAVRRR